MSVASALLTAFASRLGPVHQMAYRETPWFSATFSGSRHVYVLGVEDTVDVTAFAREIAEADIALPRGFVADISVGAVQQKNPRLIEIEALTIDP